MIEPESYPNLYDLAGNDFETEDDDPLNQSEYSDENIIEIGKII